MARISKQNKIALVECLIISSPVLLLLILSILGLTIGARTGPHEGHALFFMFAFTVLVMFLISIAFYTNVAFFLISMKKIKSRANTFLYGASFTLFIAFALMIYLLGALFIPKGVYMRIVAIFQNSALTLSIFSIIMMRYDTTLFIIITPPVVQSECTFPQRMQGVLITSVIRLNCGKILT